MRDDSPVEFGAAMSRARNRAAQAARSGDERLAQQVVTDLAQDIAAACNRELTPNATTDNEILRDCPMCITGRPVVGTTTRDYGHGPRQMWAVTCWRCLTTTRLYHRRQDAVDIWNGTFRQTRTHDSNDHDRQAETTENDRGDREEPLATCGCEAIGEMLP